MDFSPTALVAACLPPVALAWYSHRSVDGRRSPAWLVVCLFLLGAASVGLLSLLPEAFLSAIDRISDPYLAALAEAFLGAALPEEVIRLLLVGLAAGITSRAGGPMRGMAHGGIIGAGFALSESLLGSLGGEGLLLVAAGRALGAIGHWSSGLIMGYFIGLAIMAGPTRRRFLLLASALVVPTLLHTLYDFGILAEVPGAEETPDGELPPWPALALMLLTVTSWLVTVAWAVIAIRRTKAARIKEPASPRR